MTEERPPPKSLLFHWSRRQPECAEAAEELSASLTAAGFDVSEGLEGYSAKSTEILVLFGGDGFLLETLQLLDFPPTPVFGLNFGSVGFLMNPRACLPNLTQMLQEWAFKEEEHAVLEADVTFQDGTRTVAYACNDFVIERMSGQSIRIEIYLDGVFFNRFSGDGFVLCTAAGSTAYNLAAGGPVLHPDLQSMVLTPLYPHRAAPFHSLQFTLLIPHGCELKIRSEETAKRQMRVLADGRAIEQVSAIRIADSGRRLRLLRSSEHNFFSVLSRKFIGESHDRAMPESP